MLGGLHRTGLQGEVELELILPQDQQDQEARDDNQPEEEGTHNGQNAKRKRVLKFTEGQGEKTLDKQENLVMSQFDTEIMIDPLFKQTTQKFDEVSFSSLLTSRLQANHCLLIQFDSSMPNSEPSTHQSAEMSERCRQVFAETFDAQEIQNDSTQYLSKGLDQYLQL